MSATAESSLTHQEFVNCDREGTECTKSLFYICTFTVWWNHGSWFPWEKYSSRVRNIAARTQIPSKISCHIIFTILDIKALSSCLTTLRLNNLKNDHTQNWPETLIQKFLSVKEIPKVLTYRKRNSNQATKHAKI